MKAKEVLKMKRNFWELIFSNRIVYYFGTKEEVLAKTLSQKPISLHTISQKSLIAMVKTDGVQKI